MEAGKGGETGREVRDKKTTAIAVVFRQIDGGLRGIRTPDFLRVKETL